MTNRRSFIRNSALAAAGLLVADPMLRHLYAGMPGSTPGEGLRFRQVHLDFHTSGLIEDVASEFDPGAFAATLKKAYVNSVTCFGRCHHGYAYHDSRNFMHIKHPHLKRNLLKEQIEACNKQNIRVPVYVTVQWDQLVAEQHPEWLVRDENGAPIAFGDTNAFKPGFYNHLDIATPYRDYLKAYLKDLFEAVPVPGLFLDIHHIMPNANAGAIRGMVQKGLDPSKQEVRLRYAAEVMADYKRDLTEFIHKLDKNCAVFYNGGHIGPHVRSSVSEYAHLELESLPSGGWGYLHFPLTARYARNLGKDIMGMTGKFHTSWGDFHSLKNQPALDFETGTMLALNARCSVGDQLHPKGKLDEATYALIGHSYKQVAEKEPWCVGAKALTEIGVLSTEEFGLPGMAGRTPEAMMGAVRILQEGGHQFDVLDSHSEFAPYKLLIMPDGIPVGGPLKSKLQSFVAGGGKLLFSYRSGLTEDGSAFAFPELGVELVGAAPYSPDYIMSGTLSKGLPGTELVMYQKGLQVRARNGAQVLADVRAPYFNREWNHYSSHKHTPSSGKTAYPAVVQQGGVIYFMHPIFTQYAANAPVWCKKLVLNAVERLLPEPLLRHNGPSGLLATLNEQAAEKRRVLHLLYYVPERRGADFDVIEDVIPIEDVMVSVQAPAGAKAWLAPQNKPLAGRRNGSRLEFTVPRIEGHQMVVIR